MSRDGTAVLGSGVLAEGPVLDALIASGGTTLRPATDLERLTGAIEQP